MIYERISNRRVEFRRIILFEMKFIFEENQLMNFEISAQMSIKNLFD